MKKYEAQKIAPATEVPSGVNASKAASFDMLPKFLYGLNEPASQILAKFDSVF